ncbi:hypothetical protein ACFY0F_29165 [Streptomyces sp. NPDC001544]|uniref:hypothetical protein n=1 Tax=Streptomyces sp. NPDC001544 TaxID=3364584 RepID=UPI00368913FF
MLKTLAADNVLTDADWRAAVETLPRHRFAPGFSLPADERDTGLTVWEQPATSCSSCSARISFGDVKLALVLSAVLGWYSWAIILVGTFAGYLSARCPGSA